MSSPSYFSSLLSYLSPLSASRPHAPRKPHPTSFPSPAPPPSTSYFSPLLSYLSSSASASNQSVSINNAQLDAVINVFADYCNPSFSQPWQIQEESECAGSGFVIHGRRILTNAHCVVNKNSVVRVKKRKSERKYIAKILEIGHECDLALLAVEDDDFWQGLTPLNFGQLPKLQEKVFVVGYPTGGENICISAGVVSRIQMQAYEQAKGLGYLLSVQVDAAINSGNSGGPALNSQNQVVGIAFESAAGSSAVENVGYLIPETVITHFLNDYDQTGHFRGFCDYGFMWQSMESPSLRKYFSMNDGDSGILVCNVKKTAPAADVMKKDDIVTHIDGVSISNAGTVPVDFGEPIPFHYIVSKKHPREFVSFRVLRDGNVLEVEYEIRESSEHILVPVRERRAQPEYFILAGIVFVVLTVPYLESNFGSDWGSRAPSRLREKVHHNLKQNKDQQIIVVAQVLSSEITLADGSFHDSLVTKVNGTEPRNLAHMVQMVDDCDGDFVRFELDDDFVVVVDLKEARETADDILQRHAIPSERSLGVMPLRSKKKTN